MAGIWDSITGGVSNFFDDNFSTFLPDAGKVGWGLPVAVGLGIYDRWRQQQAQEDYIDELRRQAEEEWARGQNNYNAYQDYVGQYYTGEPNYSVVPNEELLAKIPELQAIMEQGTADAVETLRPFREINEAVTPKMLKAYARGLRQVPKITKAVFSPAAMELLGVSSSPMKQKLGLSDYLRGKD